MGVYLWNNNYSDYSAMQGPAPDGFHVPLTTEWGDVYDVRTDLGGGSSDGTNFGIALKMPFVGRRMRSSSDVITQGTYGYYWSSSRLNASRAYNLYFTSSTINATNNFYCADGFPIRCFKDIPTVPTSSWTKLYGTSIEAGGIFWSSADGLISLSSNGQTWITIADKNLGATQVRNDGDTLSEANCGKYYQRGNNYGFPFTGNVTTSSTQVDASSYGPGNYYSSSTFITYNGAWDTTDNRNLRGGETGVKHMSELKNAYVGEYHSFSFSYDFTTGSKADFQSKGWTVPNSATINSNGYLGSNWEFATLTTSDIENASQVASKLKMEITWSATGVGQRVFALLVSGTEDTLFYGDGASAVGGNSARFGNESLFTESGANYGNNGTYTNTITVDLVNKTWKYEGTGHTTLTGTVTDTAITSFRLSEAMHIYCDSNVYIREISITIE